MKNRKLLYVLIPSTLIIWGMIGYNIYKGLRNKNKINIPLVEDEFQIKDDLKVESYDLILDYRDPFGVETIVKIQEKKETAISSKNHVLRQSPKIKHEERIIWPQVQYNGIISHDDRTIALLKINNKNTLLSEGEEVRQIMLLKMHADSVILKFQNETQTLKLTKE